MKRLIVFNMQCRQMSIMHEEPYKYTNESNSLHEDITNNSNDNVKFHPQQNMLMMILVGELTTSLINLIALI